MPQQAVHSLRVVRLFSDLPADVLKSIEKQCTWSRFDPGQSVVEHNDASNDVYFVVSGEARVMIYSVSGKAVAFRSLHKGDLFGELAAIDSGPRSASVEAVSQLTLASIPASDFHTLLGTHPQLSHAMNRHLVGQIRSLTDRIYQFSTLAVRNRIQAELLRLARAHQTGSKTAAIQPAPTAEEIANHISTHREAVSREFSRLTRQGIMKRQGKTIYIEDVGRLAHLVSQASGDDD